MPIIIIQSKTDNVSVALRFWCYNGYIYGLRKNSHSLNNWKRNYFRARAFPFLFALLGKSLLFHRQESFGEWKRIPSPIHVDIFATCMTDQQQTRMNNVIRSLWWLNVIRVQQHVFFVLVVVGFHLANFTLSTNILK